MGSILLSVHWSEVKDSIQFVQEWLHAGTQFDLDTRSHSVSLETSCRTTNLKQNSHLPIDLWLTTKDTWRRSN